jgi:hypothetical protein
MSLTFSDFLIEGRSQDRRKIAKKIGSRDHVIGMVCCLSFYEQQIALQRCDHATRALLLGRRFNLSAFHMLPCTSVALWWRQAFI